MRRLHLAVPPHELLDGNLRVFREVVDLRAVVVILRRRATHLLLQRRLIVLLVLALADDKLVLVLGGTGTGSSSFPRVVLDDISERRVVLVRSVLLRHVVGAVLGFRRAVPGPRRNRRLRLGGGFHLAVPRQELLDGHLRVFREVADLFVSVPVVVVLRRRATHLLLQRRLVILLRHLGVVGDVLVLAVAELIGAGAGAGARRGGKRQRNGARRSAVFRSVVFGTVVFGHPRELRGEHARIPLRLP